MIGELISTIFVPMRIWSIHPKYLDSKGLVALWRETLLAKKVLENKTKGYKNHPQLQRFRESNDSLGCINQYLAAICEEAIKRNYSFDKRKISKNAATSSLTVTRGQINFEVEHLKRKLKVRDIEKLKQISKYARFEPHPLFKIVPGKVESWEKGGPL